MSLRVILMRKRGDGQGFDEPTLKGLSCDERADLRDELEGMLAELSDLDRIESAHKQQDEQTERFALSDEINEGFYYRQRMDREEN